MQKEEEGKIMWRERKREQAESMAREKGWITSRLEIGGLKNRSDIQKGGGGFDRRGG